MIGEHTNFIAGSWISSNYYYNDFALSFYLNNNPSS